MTLVWTIAVFAGLALVALAFALTPIIRAKSKGRALLMGAVALFMLGVGGGAYLMLGRPSLALRSLQGADTDDINGLVPLLIRRTRQAPGDVRAWTYLGRIYLQANDPDDAAKAFARAVTVARLAHRPDPALYSAYGEALVQSQGGAVGNDAQKTFMAALAIDPRNKAARYYLGLAAAMQGDRAKATAFWQSLLADLPPDAPQHAMLVDRLAALGAAGPAPDINAMVNGLAARLKQDPHDAQGWQRLIRAYAVLGQKDKAEAALATARKSLPPAAQNTLAAEARELKLE
jgi:cytochrome c-type biogenesis protein CcmH